MEVTELETADIIQTSGLIDGGTEGDLGNGEIEWASAPASTPKTSLVD